MSILATTGNPYRAPERFVGHQGMDSKTAFALADPTAKAITDWHRLTRR